MWPKLEKCLISLGSGKYYFSNVCLNAYDNHNTIPQTVKPAKCNCVCGPVSTLYYIHVRIMVSYNNIKRFMKYLNKFFFLNPSDTKLFVTYTLYMGEVARTPYYHINPQVQELNILWDIRDILEGGGELINISFSYCCHNFRLN